MFGNIASSGRCGQVAARCARWSAALISCGGWLIFGNTSFGGYGGIVLRTDQCALVGLLAIWAPGLPDKKSVEKRLKRVTIKPSRRGNGFHLGPLPRVFSEYIRVSANYGPVAI